jgi:type IV pilus assembly protein PilV
MLVEVLVAALIFAFGVLGIVGLQAYMAQAQTQGKFRADASYLAQELIGRIWSDLPSAAQYSSANCAARPACLAWRTKAQAMLPGSTFNVAVTGVGTPITSYSVVITINWRTPDGVQHSYSTRGAVGA